MELSLFRLHCRNVGYSGFTIKQYLVKLACVIDTTGFRAKPWILEYRCSIFFYGTSGIRRDIKFTSRWWI